MKLTINEKKDNPLLSRTEVRADIEFDATTPSNKDVQAELAKKLSVDAELVVVKQIRTGFGQRKAGVKANAYSKKDVMMKIEGIKPPKKGAESGEEKKE